MGGIHPERLSGGLRRCTLGAGAATATSATALGKTGVGLTAVVSAASMSRRQRLALMAARTTLEAATATVDCRRHLLQLRSSISGGAAANLKSLQTRRLLPTRAAVPDGRTIVGVASGWRHSLALDSDGRVLSWGWGSYGQLGHGERQ